MSRESRKKTDGSAPIAASDTAETAEPLPAADSAGIDKLSALPSDLPDRLLAWYGGARRDLPWRTDPTPYHVWISEIMLQQTRIEAVKAYYARFLEYFPEIRDLANAPEQQVMKLWEGLGYYSRARNLQRAAQICRDEYGGALPADYGKLRALPGIGDYTAGAIGSIAFRLPVPAVDGNVLRVVTRVLADPSDISKEKVKRELTRKVAEILPQDRSGEFNQALMELGETLCIPNGAPICRECPLRSCCQASQNGDPESYPVKAPKKPRRIEEMTVLVVRCGGCYAIRRRPETGLLAGLYELPWLPEFFGEPQMRQWLGERGMAGSLRELPETSHIFSHVEWHMRGWALELPAQLREPGWEYYTAEQIRREYPVPTAMKKYDRYMV